MQRIIIQLYQTVLIPFLKTSKHQISRKILANYLQSSHG